MIKVFKFGGASIKDAASIINVSDILSRYQGQSIVVIVSALGKTTNALEEITNSYFFKKGNAHELLDQLRQKHFDILNELFTDPQHPVFNEVNNSFVEIDWILEDEPHAYYDYI